MVLFRTVGFSYELDMFITAGGTERICAFGKAHIPVALSNALASIIHMVPGCDVVKPMSTMPQAATRATTRASATVPRHSSATAKR